MQVIVHASGVPGGATQPIRLAEFGALEDIEFSTAWGDLIGGHDQASWKIALHNLAIRGLIARGDHVTIWDAGTKVWGGAFNSAVVDDDGALQMTARGNGYALGRFLALDYTGAGPTYVTTTNPRIAVADAMDRGLAQALDAYTPSDISNTDYSADSESLGMTTVSDLVVAAHRELGERVAVWDRILVVDSDPTDPIWRYDAGGAVLSGSDAETTSTVWVRYQATSPSSGSPVTAANLNLAHYPPNPDSTYSQAEVGFDVADQGLMGPTRATAIARQMYEQVAQKAGIVGTLEFGDGGAELQAIDGGPARLTLVRAGQMMRVTRSRSALVDLSPERSSEFIIGSTQFSMSEGKRTLTVAPLEPAVLTLADVVARVMATDRGWRLRTSEVPA